MFAANDWKPFQSCFVDVLPDQSFCSKSYQMDQLLCTRLA
jgi:hypothetical protein